MAITADEVHYIARLARLRLDDDAVEKMAQQMSQMLDYVDQLRQVDTEGVPPMAHVLDLTNVTRPDVVQQRISHDDALRNAPDADGDYFRVPKVIG